MSGKLIFILALSVAAASLGGAARAESEPDAMKAIACGSGYHVYRDGSCQPDIMTVDNRCPDGFVAYPFPNGNGYRCGPEPQIGGVSRPN